MSSPCKCRDWSCSSNRDFAVMETMGHHPTCGMIAMNPPNDEEIIFHLLNRVRDQQQEIERLSARCNRMVSSAAIDDVTWRPE